MRKNPIRSPESRGGSSSPIGRRGALSWPRFMTDPIWWFYIFWLPSYLKQGRGFTPRGNRPVLLDAVFWFQGWAAWRADGFRGSSSSAGGRWAGRARRPWPCARFACPPASWPSSRPISGWALGLISTFPGRAPGMVGECLHSGLRHVSQTRCGLGNGPLGERAGPRAA